MKRDALVAIVGKIKKDKGIGASAPEMSEEEEGEGEEMGADDGLHSAAQSLISAFQSKSASGVVSALKSFISQCHSDSYDEEDEE